jgi:putative phosphoribosyl transferase
MVVFEDRVDAGTRLARELEVFRGQDVVVLGLPRGGVPVAAVVAEALDAPLDVIVVRKLGVPFQPELAMGVLEARVDRLRRGRPRIDLRGRVAVVVDDGIATGATARVACQVARQLGAARVVLAVPVAPAHTAAHLPEADDVVCVSAPQHFSAVGAHYVDFSPTSDDEVVALLDRAGHRAQLPASSPGLPDARSPGSPNSGATREIDEQAVVPVGRESIEGHLRVPLGAPGVVLFAHGSGSSRHSPRNRFVADVLHDAGLGTVLLDLLTPREERDRGNVFDIPLLAGRLTAATAWVTSRADTGSCRIGWFGASTGAGAALWAAAEPRSPVAAVVSRGGRPDLAGARLSAVRAPTLLIVGGADEVVLRLNRQARAQLVGCTSELAVVPGATHLFEEPGTLAEAASLARDWFVHHLALAGTTTGGGESR